MLPSKTPNCDRTGVSKTGVCLLNTVPKIAPSPVDSVTFVVVAAVSVAVAARVDSALNQTSTVSVAVFDRLLLRKREMVRRRQCRHLVPPLAALRYPP